MKSKGMGKQFRYKGILLFTAGIVLVLAADWGLERTSENSFCDACHIHPQASTSWRLGVHSDTPSGVVVGCVECHLPPEGLPYLRAKAVTGLRDVYGLLFKDENSFNWEMKSTREAANKHVYKASCIKCHQNLFPRTLTKKGEDAHLYYDRNAESLRCINCHLEVGHFSKEEIEKMGIEISPAAAGMIYTSPARVDSFANFTETVPGTAVGFDMIAVPGGRFLRGSPEHEAYRRDDEGPQQEIVVDSFWMGRCEVSWDEYEAFLMETGVQGRTEDQKRSIASGADVDAVTGPTPPYGNPGQGWGKGKRPAITMTHYAARRYCEWLSKKTGRTYRLPTEAEWEYACRAGTETPYFFEGDPAELSTRRLWNRLFGVDTTVINDYVVFEMNSQGKTHLPEAVNPNPFGLVHMLGNVREFCLDTYVNSYAPAAGDLQGTSGQEFVIRGGSFKSAAEVLRCAARDYTRHDAWLVTDPQIPKSLWWYSDCNDVGFRVICENRNFK